MNYQRQGFTKFEYCLYLLEYLQHRDEKALNIILKEDYTYIIFSFQREFKQNLLFFNQAKNRKIKAIKYHISELLTTATFFKRYEKIIFSVTSKSGDFIKSTTADGQSRQLDKEEAYVYEAYDFISRLLTIINECCVEFNIDFIALCNELNFPHDFFDLYTYKFETTLNNSVEAEINGKKINAPLIALFCQLLDESGILKRGIKENIEEYCKRVCEKFNFEYRTRIRQAYLRSYSRQNLFKLEQHLLPTIDESIRTKILDHLNKNVQK